MAKFSPLLGHVRGPVGGIVYRRSRGGATLGLRPLPVHTQTPIQSLNRTSISQAVAAWDALSAADREKWDAYATTHPHTDPLGNTVQAGGRAAFIGRWAFCRRLVFPTPPPLPNGVIPADREILTATMSAAGTVTVSHSPAPAGAGTRIRILVSQPTGGQPRRDPRRASAMAFSTLNPGSPITLFPPSRWRAWPGARQWVWLEYVRADALPHGRKAFLLQRPE